MHCNDGDGDRGDAHLPRTKAAKYEQFVSEPGIKREAGEARTPRRGAVRPARSRSKIAAITTLANRIHRLATASRARFGLAFGITVLPISAVPASRFVSWTVPHQVHPEIRTGTDWLAGAKQACSVCTELEPSHWAERRGTERRRSPRAVSSAA